MLAALHESFREVAFQPDTLMFDRVAGGIRLRNDSETERLARFLQIFELFAVQSGLVRAGGFMFAGESPRRL